MRKIWIFALICIFSPLTHAQNYNATATFRETKVEWDGAAAKAWLEQVTSDDWTTYFTQVGSPEYCWLQDWRPDASGDTYSPPLHTARTIADAHCVIPLPGWPPELIYTNYVSYQVYTCDSGFYWGEDPATPGSYGCQPVPYNAGKNNGAPCDCAGDPINLATGNEYRDDDDAQLGPLSFHRYYNSHNSVVSARIGAHWRHTFDRNLEFLTTSSASMVRPDGLQVAFSLQNGQWVTDTDVADRLTTQTDATGATTGWTYFDATSRSSELYDITGRLVSITDDSGQATTLIYSAASTPSSTAPSSGLLLAVTDAHGRSLSFVYNASGNISSVTKPDGEVLSYDYDANGDLSTVTYPGGKNRRYIYNEPALTGGANLAHALTGDFDESGNRLTSIGYNSSRQATMSTLPGGVDLTKLAYNADGTTSVTYPTGVQVALGFVAPTGAIHTNTVSAPCGKQCGQPNASATFDSNGYVASTADFNGNHTELTHDSYGLLTTEVDDQGGPDQRTEKTTWDTLLRVPSSRTVLDNQGKVIGKKGWAYNATGLITAVCDIDVAASPSYTCSTADSAPSGVRRSVLTYCTALDTSSCPLVGLLLKSDGPRTDVSDTVNYAYYLTTDESGCTTLGGACHHLGDLQSTTDGAGLVTTYVSYDKAGRVTRIKDPNGVLTDYTYTPRGWLATTTIRANASGVASVSDAVTTVTYDPTGTVHSVKDPDGVTTTYTYDAAHRLTDITDALGSRIHYTLDVAGNRTAEQILSPTGGVVRSLGRSYNALGQLTAITDGLNRTVFNAGFTDSYDGNGNLVHTQDALSVQQKQVYDGLNRLVSTLRDYQGMNTATANAQSVTSFDALDRVTGFSDPDGLNTTYDFDGLGNATGLHSPDTGTTTRGFDVSGHPVSSVDAANVATTSTYDALNRLTRTTYADTTLNVAYHYDEADAVTGCTGNFGKGRLTRLVEGSGGLVYCYDGHGNVVRKQQTVGTSSRTTTYTWSAANRLQSVTTPNGTRIAYTRNSLGQTTSIQATANGLTTTVVSQAVYQPFGPLASYTLGDGQTVTRSFDGTGALTDIASTAFSLHVKRDAMGDVVALGDTTGAANPTETYTYDSLYRLTGITAADSASNEAYTYNKTGDRLSKVAPGLQTGAYTYKSDTHQLVAVGSNARQVDARGNTTASVQALGTYGYSYNERNRLTDVQVGGVTVGSYVLNAVGQRVQKVAGGAVTSFDYDEGNWLLGEQTGTSRRDYVWLDDVPVGIVDMPGPTSLVTSRAPLRPDAVPVPVYTYAIHADGLGTPRVITDVNGVVQWQWAYAENPFGERSPASPAGFVFNLRLPGQYFDAESGLIYNSNRDYEATTGRYVQSDPLGILVDSSTYAYVMNRPLDIIDPTGLAPPNNNAWRNLCLLYFVACNLNHPLPGAAPPETPPSTPGGYQSLPEPQGNGLGGGLKRPEIPKPPGPLCPQSAPRGPVPPPAEPTPPRIPPPVAVPPVPFPVSVPWFFLIPQFLVPHSYYDGVKTAALPSDLNVYGEPA